MPSPLAVFSAALFLATPPTAQPLRETRPDKFPRPPDEPSRAPAEVAPPARAARIFGIGVGFERSGTLAGVPLTTVLPDSPAFRAGLMKGSIVSEINGESTAGRSGEECARLIISGGTTVRMKVLDPTLRERLIVLEKVWLVVPE